MKRQQESDQGNCRIVEDILHCLRELGDSQIKKKKRQQGLEENVQDGSIRRLKLPRGAGKIGLNLNSFRQKDKLHSSEVARFYKSSEEDSKKGC